VYVYFLGEGFITDHLKEYLPLHGCEMYALVLFHCSPTEVLIITHHCFTLQNAELEMELINGQH